MKLFSRPKKKDPETAKKTFGHTDCSMCLNSYNRFMWKFAPLFDELHMEIQQIENSEVDLQLQLHKLKAKIMYMLDKQYHKE